MQKSTQGSQLSLKFQIFGCIGQAFSQIHATSGYFNPKEKVSPILILSFN